MSKINLSILVNDDHLAEILEVAQRLQSAGLEVEQVMDAIGVISGSCEAQKVDSLSQVKGVAKVEAQQSYQLAPPDSEVQ